MSRKTVWIDILLPFIWMYLALATAVMLVSMAVMLIWGSDIETVEAAPMLVSGTAYMLVMFGLRKQYAQDSVRFYREHPEYPAAFTVLCMAGSAFLADLLTLAIRVFQIDRIFPGYARLSAVSFENQSPVLLLTVTVLLAPIAEELIFRGLIYRRAANGISVRSGIFISAVCFGIYHMNVVQFIHAACMGVLFALAFEKSRRLETPVLMHASANLYTIAVYRIIGPYMEKRQISSLWRYGAESIALILIFLILRKNLLVSDQKIC